MASRTKSQPTWTDVKAKLASFHRTGLLGLIQDLYAAHKDVSSRLIVRLDRVRSISHKLGYGVGDDMDSIFAKYTKHKA
jgi:hypothetical protein